MQNEQDQWPAGPFSLQASGLCHLQESGDAAFSCKEQEQLPLSCAHDCVAFQCERSELPVVCPDFQFPMSPWNVELQFPNLPLPLSKPIQLLLPG